MGQPPPTPYNSSVALAPIQPCGAEISNGDGCNEEHQGERFETINVSISKKGIMPCVTLTSVPSKSVKPRRGEDMVVGVFKLPFDAAGSVPHHITIRRSVTLKAAAVCLLSPLPRSFRRSLFSISHPFHPDRSHNGGL